MAVDRVGALLQRCFARIQIRLGLREFGPLRFESGRLTVQGGPPRFQRVRLRLAVIEIVDSWRRGDALRIVLRQIAIERSDLCIERRFLLGVLTQACFIGRAIAVIGGQVDCVGGASATHSNHGMVSDKVVMMMVVRSRLCH